MAGRPQRTTVLTRLAGPLAVHGKGPAAIGRTLDELRLLGVRRSLEARQDRTGAYLRGEARRLVYRWLWQDAVDRLGGTLVDLPGGFLSVEVDGARFRVYEQLVPVDDPVAQRFAGNKPLTHAALRTAGLRVPEHLDVGVAELDRLTDFVHAHGACVLKPSRGGGSGHGVTGGVQTREDVLRSRLRAARWDPDRVLIEEQVVGREFRILVLEGKVIGAIERERPAVTGDGRASVLQLIRAENLRRVNARGFAGIVPLRPTLDAHLALRPQGLTLHSVPDRGRTVRVATATSTSSERETTTVQASDLHDVAVRAAETVGAELSSVEAIVPEHGHAQDVTIVEVNTTPGLAHHYLVRDPRTATPVAATLARWLAEREVRRQPRRVG